MNRKAVKKHAGIKKQIEQKVRQIISHPVEVGEPLRKKFRGFYSCPVKRNFIIIYLYCNICRKKGDDEYVACFRMKAIKIKHVHSPKYLNQKSRVRFKKIAFTLNPFFPFMPPYVNIHGTEGISAPLSVLADENGFWFFELVNARNANYKDLFRKVTLNCFFKT